MIGAVMSRPLARRLVCPLIVGALLAGCAPAGTIVDPSGVDPSGRAAVASEVSGPAATGTPETAACPPSGVRLELGGVDAAMGLRALGVYLVNCGREAYRVNGYPAVHALDEQRSTLDVRVLDGVTEIAGSLPGWAGAPRPVVLSPGERAAAVVVWRNTYDNISKPPVDAPYLEVAPTAGRPAQVLAPQGGIDLGSTGRLGVSPWRQSRTPATRQPSNPPTTPTVPLA
jgi:hypothetical protein